MNTTHLVFACDESGAKGYANQVESYPGEVGVFAGILVPQETEVIARPTFQAIYNQYQPASGKLHIADLVPADQTALRQAIYEAIRTFNLPCFWYAIHVDGLNSHYLDSKANRGAVIPERQQRSPVKLGSQRDTPASMHEELFAGLYSHLIAFLEERHRKEVSVEVRTDQIDSPIVRNFEEFAKRLLSEDQTLSTVTGWNTVTKQVVEGHIEVRVDLPADMQIKVAVKNLTINTVGGGDGYVLGADVLANSINYLFKHRDTTDRFKPLNRPAAVASHPLSAHLDSFTSWGRGDRIGDQLYRHPKSEEP